MLWKTTRIPAGQLNKALSASQNVLVNTEEREEEKERERERERVRDMNINLLPTQGGICYVS